MRESKSQATSIESSLNAQLAADDRCGCVIGTEIKSR
jgi:hypothetical protein